MALNVQVFCQDLGRHDWLLLNIAPFRRNRSFGPHIELINLLDALRDCGDNPLLVQDRHVVLSDLIVDGRVAAIRRFFEGLLFIFAVPGVVEVSPQVAHHLDFAVVDLLVDACQVYLVALQI